MLEEKIRLPSQEIRLKSFYSSFWILFNLRDDCAVSKQRKHHEIVGFSITTIVEGIYNLIVVCALIRR